jgi:hypothetical protein
MDLQQRGAITAAERSEAVATAYRSHIREVNTDQGSQFYAKQAEAKRRAKVSADLSGI